MVAFLFVAVLLVVFILDEFFSFLAKW